MIDERFIILGAVLSFIGHISYITDTVSGKAKPNRITWFLWALIPMIAFSAEINEGVGLASLMTFMVGFGPLLIFGASFINKKSYWEIKPLDIFCGILSLFGVLLWMITKSGNLAILFSILADGSAAVPTVIKAYHFPETENYMVFFLSGINALITLLAISGWNFAYFAFPIYIFLICLTMVLLVRFRIGNSIQKEDNYRSY